MTYILSFIVAFGVAAIVGQLLIPLLRRLKAGQSIRADGPAWHMSKQGTPTMGGLMFIAAIPVTLLIFGWKAIAWALSQGRPGDVIVLAGKGHETYQEINGVQYHMDEREIVADWFKQTDNRQQKTGNIPAGVI